MTEKTAKELLIDYIDYFGTLKECRKEMRRIEERMLLLGIDVRPLIDMSEQKGSSSLMSIENEEKPTKRRLGNGKPMVLVLNHINGLPPETTFGNAQVREHLGIPSSTLSSALTRLAEQGLIRRVSQGVWTKNNV